MGSCYKGSGVLPGVTNQERNQKVAGQIPCKAGSKQTRSTGSMKGGISRREQLAMKDHVKEKKTFSMNFGLGSYYFPSKDLSCQVTQYGYLIKGQKNEMKVRKQNLDIYTICVQYNMHIYI